MMEEKNCENCSSNVNGAYWCQKRKAAEVVASRVQFLENANGNKSSQQEPTSHHDDISGINLDDLPL